MAEMGFLSAQRQLGLHGLNTKRQQKRNESFRKSWEVFEERLKRERLSVDVVSCASDAKWLRIFDALRVQFPSTGSIQGGASRVKLLRDDEPFEFPYLLSSCFEDEYLEGHYGFFGYREIEWIEIQAGGISAEVDCEVDCEVIGDALRVYGYRRSEG